MAAQSTAKPDLAPRGAQLSGAGLPTRLFHYPPHLRQPAHRHARPHISIVIAGSLAEETDRGEHIVTHGAAVIRADDTRHAVRFGPAGALVMTLDLDRWPLRDCPRGGIVFTRQMSPADMLARCAADRRLPFNAAFPDLSPAGRPWLDDAAQQLLKAPWSASIADLARRAGVHRAHFHRLFRRRYGLAPSVFRRRAMTAHALSQVLAGGEALATAAIAAGFADQSHMSRAVAESCGMTAGRMRTLLAGPATFVQSDPAVLS